MRNSQAITDVPEDVRLAPYPASIEHAVGPLGQERTRESDPFSEVAALCPIGAFDSGLGGLSIIAEIRRLLPAEDIVYYADNGYCPYGGRSDEWLRERSLYLARFLIERGAKVIVVACNTASAAGLEHLRATFSVPVVGLVPAVKPAVAATRTGTVGVLATNGTNRGRLLSDVIDRFATPANVKVVVAAPTGLVEAVEAGELDTPETAEAVRRAIEPMLEQGVDALVLGCTHYPFLKPLLRQIAGEGMRLIDSGDGVARQTKRVLEARHLLRDDKRDGVLTVYTSGEIDVVRPLVWRLVGEEVEVNYEL